MANLFMGLPKDIMIYKLVPLIQEPLRRENEQLKKQLETVTRAMKSLISGQKACDIRKGDLHVCDGDIIAKYQCESCAGNLCNDHAKRCFLCDGIHCGDNDNCCDICDKCEKTVCFNCWDPEIDDNKLCCAKFLRQNTARY
jgi:hypothetical protein